MKMTVCGGTVMTLASFEWGRNALLQYPEFFSYGLFSHAGPTEQQLKETSFSMDFRIKGYSKTSAEDTMEMKACVSGPEPGYVATPIIFIVLAKTLLSEYASGSMPKGGVLTPAAAFRNSPTIIGSLNEAGITFTCE